MKLGAKQTSFWDVFTLFPPYFVRLLAKRGQRLTPKNALSDADIAIASGIDLNRVRQINYMLNWNAVPLGEILRYCTACSFDPTQYADRARVNAYLHQCQKHNKPAFSYLRKSPRFESEILPMLKLLYALTKSTHRSAA